MQVSLRVPEKTGNRLNSLAKKTGKTKSALIMEALDEKYYPEKDRAHLIRELSGWMPRTECNALREAVTEFNAVNDEDWQ
jgi:hypothetical protein